MHGLVSILVAQPASDTPSSRGGPAGCDAVSVGHGGAPSSIHLWVFRAEWPQHGKSDAETLAQPSGVPGGMWAGLFWLVAGVAVITAAGCCFSDASCEEKRGRG